MAAASSGSGADHAASGGTRTEAIVDPSFNNMKAFEVVIPAGWHFQGGMFQGGSCDNLPFPVFRASSPDGLSFWERLPALRWAWGSGPMGGKNRGTCLPLTRALGAQEFLHYMASVMKVTYVADSPIPEADKAAMAKAAQAMNNSGKSGPMPGMSTTHTSEGAGAVVQFTNGTFKMKGLMRTKVDCQHTHFPGRKPFVAQDPGVPDSESYQCTATVGYLAAPEAKYSSVEATIDNNPTLGAQPTVQWIQAYLQRQRQQSSAILNAQMQRSNAQLQAMHDSFEQSQAVQQHMHEQFMDTMQRGTDMAMAGAQENMNARSTATSDWVDYALDRKTVMDPNTGQVSKVSSAYNYTWIDNSGKVSYQTSDPNANPNGVLQGSWTKQAVVHGDGSQ